VYFQNCCDIGCNSNRELICKNKVIRGSNIFEIICYAIHKKCKDINWDSDHDNDSSSESGDDENGRRVRESGEEDSADEDEVDTGDEDDGADNENDRNDDDENGRTDRESGEEDDENENDIGAKDDDEGEDDMEDGDNDVSADDDDVKDDNNNSENETGKSDEDESDDHGNHDKFLRCLDEYANLFLALHKASPSIRQRLLKKHCDNGFIFCITECIKHILKGKVSLNSFQYKKLSVNKKILREMASNKTSRTRKCTIIQNSEFLDIILELICEH